MKILLLLLLLAFIVATNASIFGHNDEFPLTVSTPSGIYQGIYMEEARAFLGIPFAKPPVGSLRFKPPQAKPYKWGVQVVTNQPKTCWQAGANPSNSGNYDEDCLFLNVFTPKYKQRISSDIFPKLPVLVFIHGGRYWTGSASEFDGDKMASVGNSIVVIIQYRLNIFGFQPYDSNTNLGLLDQQMALKWVKDNIVSFGGDSNKITIFGESAGGSSVVHHLINPKSYGLYDRAIVESSWQWLIPNVESSRIKSNPHLIKIGCNRTLANGDQDLNGILACLNSMKPLDITPSTANSNFYIPMVDGKFITQLPLKAIKTRQYNQRADVIWGHNYDEGYYMAYSRMGYKKPNETVTDDVYYAALNKVLLVYLNQSQASDIIAKYEPLRAAKGNWFAGSEFLGDYYITCGQILATAYLDQQKVSNFKTYIFNYSSPNYPASDWFLAASHGNELAYVFFNSQIYTAYTFAPEDSFVATRMNRAWTDFADTGNPISPLSKWPTYPQAMYYGQDSTNYSDSVLYQKDICETYRQYFEANAS